jgi:phenylpropionate dioxygenase-like ring-hydroxylating dioxygenase large terminal subunit
MNISTPSPASELPSARSFIDAENGLVDRQIFSDPDIYKMEMERIFARAWNFMCHESQIRNPGDFFLTRIGDDRVIVVRDKTGRAQVLLNTCRHRGNSVCRAEQGNAKSFMCPYHGWNYGLDGKLVGVPGMKEFYHDDLDKDAWGLAKAAQVESYKGFVFATMDPDAPKLYDFLGDVGRAGLDMVADKGDVEVVDGIQKNRIGCNWKMAVDNLFDWYHPTISHASAGRSGFFPLDESLHQMNQMVMLGDYGHAISGPFVKPDEDAETSDFQQLFGAQPTLPHPNIFPNLWVTLNGMQICLRLPNGPFETEIWWFTLLEKNLPEDLRREMLHLAKHIFGPAGMLEQDDGENWAHSTRATVSPASRRYPLNYAMGKGRDEIIELPSGHKRIETRVNEHGQLWTYRSWAEWMDAENWADLEQNRTPAPLGKI